MSPDEIRAYVLDKMIDRYDQYGVVRFVREMEMLAKWIEDWRNS